MLNLHLLPAWLNGRVLLVLLPIATIGALAGTVRLLASPPRRTYLKSPRHGRAHWLP